MNRDRGAVLINALIIVLAISSVAAVLLTRSEVARLRAYDSQNGQQLGLYLSGAEVLVPGLLEEITDGGAVHPAQDWADPSLSFPIDRGSVRVEINDLQGRLNVNWLMRGDDYTKDIFTALFAELGLSMALLREIEEFVAPNGPRSVNDYLARTPAVLPRGGPVQVVDDLRQVNGMTPAAFAQLAPYLAALPSDSKLNLNTAPEPLLAAALQPFPQELQTEILERDTPIASMAEIRNRLVEIRESEELDDLPLERLTYASTWFRADLRASLDGVQQRRKLVFLIEPGMTPPIRRVAGWTVYD